MPIINVQMLEGRPESIIKDLMKNVTVTVSETLDVPEERVRVLVQEIPKSHWGIGGVSAADKKR